MGDSSANDTARRRYREMLDIAFEEGFPDSGFESERLLEAQRSYNEAAEEAEDGKERF